MKSDFEELDDETRKFMLQEFDIEQSSINPYISPRLSDIGKKIFPELMKKAIISGDAESLETSLRRQDYWKEKEVYTRNGVTKERIINYQQASEQLAFSEFNTWYVRGLSKKLLTKGIEKCQVYRVKDAKWEPGDCSSHEGQIVDTKIIYDGHRAKYWPVINKSAFSIPAQAGCHHSIRRVR